MRLDLVIAQADVAALEDLTAFNQQVLEPSAFTAILYGSVFAIGFALLVLFTVRIQGRPLSWATPLGRFAARPWTGRHAAAVVLPLVAIQLLFAWLYSMRGLPAESPSADAERNMLMLQGVLFHGAGFLLMLAVMRKSRIRWRDGFGLPSGAGLRFIGWGAVILLGTMPLIISYNLAAHLVMEWWGIEPRIQDVARVISGAAGWPEHVYFFALAVLIAPLVEEMIFRGILLPVLGRIIGVRAALVAVAFLFSLVHGFYLPAFFVFFILSVAFSLAYIYHGTLLVPVAMHALFNSLTMAVLFCV